MIEPVETAPARYVSFSSGETRAGARAVPVEHPVNIIYGGVPYAVMMATPQNLEDFVVGFSLTEGIITAASDVRDVAFEEHPRGLKAMVTLAPGVFSQHLSRQRSLSGRTGCGVCGVQDLDSIPEAKPVASAVAVETGAIARAVATIEAHQPLNDATRAVHAAGWFDLQGRHVATREDVGRHNALDKLIGALMRGGHSPEDGFILITSRCSFEMVEKTAAFGASLLVAVSAPTSLAIHRAKELGVDLIAIARKDGATEFLRSPERAMEPAHD
ncbi:formate dehydrogenase accessory sulfurtransferase FdhD [Terrarubrum flagellatum]|uniref:formate dehydrogenase accessory sulfurtransferase FdhD n=1 Tax=Terrirubrum flagellatum TaxID=2895980 RepID=UPI003144F177